MNTSPQKTISPKQATAIICLSSYKGGMELDAVKLAIKLKLVTPITVVCKQGSFIDTQFTPQLEKEGIRIARMAFKTHFSIALIRQLRKFIKNNNIVNLIFFGASEMRSIFFALIGLDTHLIVRHGTTKTHSKKDALHKLVYSRVAWHVAICEHLAKNVSFIIPFGKQSRLKIIYPSLPDYNNERRSARQPDAGPIKLLHTGRIAQGKGQKEAVQACRVLQEKNIDFELELVGEMDPNYRKEFEFFLQGIHYRNRIHLVGFTDKVNEYYCHAHIFIFPSKGEGLSNAFIEALSHGIICIAYNNTSFPELRALGFQFLLVEDKNLQDLQDTLTEIIGHIDTWNEKAAKNSLLAQILFSQRREIDEYSNILQ